MKKNFLCLKNGFTLLETLLYLTVASSMFLAFSIFLPLLLSTRVKSYFVTEVEQQGIFVLQEMVKVVENSKQINFPGVGEVSSTLSVNSYNDKTNPIVFENTGVSITETKASGSPVNLTGNNIFVTNLQFSNLSRTSAPSVIGIEFTIKSIANSESSEYNYSQTFFTTVTLRK